MQNAVMADDEEFQSLEFNPMNSSTLPVTSKSSAFQ